MSDIAIRVDGLGKQYRIGERERYRTLRDTVADTASAPFRWMRSVGSRTAHPSPTSTEHLFWALRDVSFEVPTGSVVGVIGRNGAGKSTLLKILSRITEPTEGSVEIRGRVGSLLEVGTGFHPELTGRENIYLNGAILGMRRAEIARKFDEIVAFAEIEKFIDTPVKRYSTGMYMRLAFAVAAHLEPEILVVDEVLAVGDAQFQTKCLTRMGEVAERGRTVIFVSHSMAAVASLCGSGLLLEGGQIAATGPIDTVIDAYATSISAIGGNVLPRHRTARGSGELRIVQAGVLDHAGRPCSRFSHGANVCIAFTLEQVSNCTPQMCVVTVRTSTGIPVLHLTAHNGKSHEPLRVSGSATVRCVIPDCRLYPGTYAASIWVGSTPYFDTDYERDIVAFHVEQGDLPGFGVDLGWRHALIHADSRWEILETTAVDVGAA